MDPVVLKNDSQNSDQPAHRSDCAHAQADLSLRWVLMLEGIFSQIAADTATPVLTLSMLGKISEDDILPFFGK